jgi:hypothetical protein
MNKFEFLYLIENAPVGSPITYFSGFLGSSRAKRELNKTECEVTREALEAYGRGEVDLIQRRVYGAKSHFDYIAIKRGKVTPREDFKIPRLDW